MKLYTTFNQISPAQGQLVSRIDGMTGNPAFYGLNTPIYLSDIANNIGVDAACTALPYAVGITAETSQQIAVNMLSTSLYTWQTIFPGDTIVSRLLGLLQLVIEGTPNLSGTIEGLLTTAQALVTPLSYVGSLPTYTVMYQNIGPLTVSYLLDVLGIELPGGGTPPPVKNTLFTMTTNAFNNPTIDYSQAPITGVVEPYTPMPIMAAIAIDQYVNQQFTYNLDETPYYYQLNYLNIEQSSVNLPNYTYGTATPYMTALTLVTNAILAGIDISVYPVYYTLRQAELFYSSLQQGNIQSTTVTLNQAETGVVPVNSTGNATVDAIGQSIINAGLTTRTALLRDYSYILPFDTSGDGMLEASERILLEKAVQVQMLASRTAAAQAAIASLSAEYLSFNNTDDLLPVFVTEVS